MDKFWKTDDNIYCGIPIGNATEITMDEYIAKMKIFGRNREVSELKTYLSNTDYIYAKCFELGVDVKTIYADVIERRRTARMRIQELEDIPVVEPVLQEG